MSFITEQLAIPLTALISLCYGFLHNYGLAIVLFTLLTKVILFPVALWTHRNSLKMVSLMPELNELKVKYYGDKEIIAEETQKLYKREGYHPLASMVPMLVQLVLLMGVVGAVRALLGGSESVLARIPSETGGATLLMPLAAGAAALILGLTQNRINPLQHEQSRREQIMTNAISVAISLGLGAFVPVGTGLYWICGNMFAILNQLAVNAVFPPKKFVDYPALAASKKELEGMNRLSSGLSKEEKHREKTDYKRFFSVANKHLVFYSEASGFYKYYVRVINYLLAHSNVTIHYVTSDPKDQVFELAKTQPKLRPYFIGERKLITLMMKMDAKMVVMTMPDLENFHIKRSYVRKDIEYVYMVHGVSNGLQDLRPKALDHYDTILSTGRNLDQEIRMLEEVNHTTRKKVIPCGCGVVEDMAEAYAKMEKRKRERPMVLIAPSWQADNIVESCLTSLAEALLKQGYDVIVRPHPQYLRRFPEKFEKIVQSCEGFPPGRFMIERDFSSNETVFSADLLITDWSSIGYEYAFSTLKPVLFINTPMKIVNPQVVELTEDHTTFNMRMRQVLGRALDPADISRHAGEYAADLMGNPEQYALQIEEARNTEVYFFGESGERGGRYILRALQNRE